MAEKKVSVRLSATGGRQVRAELEGVGEAGARGLGRLSREMEQANARMAAFARRARIAATAAATALAAAVVSMTRSTVAAANEIGQLSQVANANPELFQRWSAASATVGIEQEKLADILKDLTARTTLIATLYQSTHAAGASCAEHAEIVAALESVIRRDPSHVGANHYYIHAVEASPHPERALPAADRLTPSAPNVAPAL